MRWIIGITILAVIAVIGWFWYPRLIEADIANPYELLDERTWLVLDLDDPSDLQQLADSNSALAALSLLHQWPLPPALDEDRVVLFSYRDATGDQLGIITSGEDEWIPTDRFASSLKAGSYVIHTTSVYLLPNEKPSLNELLPSRTARDGKLQVHVRAEDILLSYVGSLSPAVAQWVAREGEPGLWIEFEVEDEEFIFKASGIADTKSDATRSNQDLRLLKLAPSNSSIAITSSNGDLHFGVIHCNYGVTNDPYEFLYVLYETNQNHAAGNPAQAYQGIPITIDSVPSALNLLDFPWKYEAYTARIGDVFIQSQSFESLVRLLDDYLADDKLTTSPYFTQIENTISDAGFTLYVRPDALTKENPLIDASIEWPATNSLVLQAFSELPGQKFFTVSMLHHKDIIDEAPILWSTLLDTVVQAGPWPFKNHYTSEREVLVQDAKFNLYLINKEGKTLWKKKLNAKIQGDIQTVDAFDNGKFQILLSTSTDLHLIDRNGNEVDGFPIKAEQGITAAPSFVQYSSKSEPRILFADGTKIRNVDVEGKGVKGWTDPKMASTLSTQVEYLSYSGKDYLTCRSTSGKVYFYDRRGKERMNPIQLDTTLCEVFLERGESLSTCCYIGYDTLGNLIEQPIGGKAKVNNTLPLGGDLGLIHTGIKDHDLVTISKDHLVTLDADRNVKLDYLLPESMDPDIKILNRDKMWVGLHAKDNDHFYIMDLEGHMLDKMPVIGRGAALVIDIDGNGTLELMISDGKRELRAYGLAD